MLERRKERLKRLMEEHILTDPPKVCPFFGFTDGQYDDCFKDECRLWTSASTTENVQIFDCAFVINARKNSDGLIVV